MKNKMTISIIALILVYTYAGVGYAQDEKVMATAAKSALGIKDEAPVKESDISSAYSSAVALYWDGRLNEAKTKFEQVQLMSPDYARTKYYLSRISDKQSAGVKSAEEVSRSNFTPVKKMDETAANIRAQADERIAKLESEKKAKKEAEIKARMERERNAVLEKSAQEEAWKTKLESEKKAREESDAKAKIEPIQSKAVENTPAVKVTRKQNFTHKDAVVQTPDDKVKIDTAKKTRDEAATRARLERERNAARIKAQEDAGKARLDSENKAQEEADTKARMERERNAVMEKAAQEEARRTKLESENKARDEAEAKAKAEEASPRVEPEKSEPAKIKIEVSQQMIDQQMTAYKGNLKEIVREAEANLKKIDGELKGKEAEDSVNKHLKAAGAFSAEGKTDEAKAEFKAAMVAANTPAVKKSIKEKERAIDKQAKDLDLKKQQEARHSEEVVKRAYVKTDKKVFNGTTQNITPKSRTESD